MIKLTNVQLEDEITLLLSEKNGLNELLTITLNALMKSEREAFFKENTNTNNKCNGYRPIQGTGFGKTLELRVPRDRFGVFKPLILEILRNQEEEQRDLCFELYGAGLSTRQIGEIVQKIISVRENNFFDLRIKKLRLSQLRDSLFFVILNRLKKSYYIDKIMNKSSKSILNQLLNLIDWKNFNRIISDSQSDKYSKKLKTKEHFITLFYAVLKGYDSLREIVLGMNAEATMFKQLEFQRIPARSTLSDANKKRSSDIFRKIYFQLYQQYKIFCRTVETKNGKNILK